MIAQQLPRVRITDCPVALPEGLALPALTRQTGRAFREVRVPLYFDIQFKNIWQRNKLALRQRGFTIVKRDHAWWLQQYLTGEPGNWTLTPVGAEQLAALTTPKPSAPAMEIPVELILPELPFNLEAKLLEWQPQPARQLYRALLNGKKEWGFSCAWDCSEVGTGKTYQALAAAVATGMRIGVVCPKAVIPAWHAAFKHFGERPEFVINYESLRVGRPGIIRKTGNAKALYEWQVDPDEVMIIWDEAHRMKNNSGTRKLGLAAFRQDFRQLFLSGTMAESPLNLYVTGMAVGLHRGDIESYEQFLRTHGCFKAGQTWRFDRKTGGHHLVKINRLVFPQRGCRVRISDLGDKFPKTQIISRGVRTDAADAIQKAYEEGRAALALMNLQGKSPEAIARAEQFAYMKARKLSEIAKVEALIEMAEDEMEEGRAVMLFVNFTESREKLMTGLKTACGIFGDQNSVQRENCIQDFQEDRSRVIVVMSQAGGTGVNLQDVRGEFPRSSIICADNNAVTLGQVLGRPHRAGGKSTSRQIIVFSEGTLEEEICENARQKLKNIASLNDGEINPQAKF